MKVYYKFFEMHLKRQLQHRLSFFFIALGQACFALTSLITIVFLMPSGTAVLGFTRDEVLLAGAIINLSYSSAECFARGFDSFSASIRRGDFDRVLVRPLSEIGQVFMLNLDFTRIGRFIVALVTLGIVLNQLPPLPWFYLAFLVVTGCFVYTCLFIIYGSICFYTTENLEFFNILTDGTKEFGKAPFSFYGKPVLHFLTFILPLACIQYYPLLFILGKSSNVVYALSPLFAYLFIFPTFIIWTHGRMNYSSAGN